jgi:hypothetical protein
MKRKQLFVLLGCLFACIIILVGLYAFSPLSKEISRNSFERNFTEGPAITQKGILDIEYNSFYIAGATQDKIYLGNSTAPFHLLTTNHVLADTQHIMLRVKLDSMMEPRRFRLSVESPYFFLSHGTMPKLLRGKIGDWEASRFLPDSADYFVEAVPMGPSSLAFRSYSMSTKEYELAKKSTNSSFRFNFDLLQKQIDGLFCVDGQLHYSKELKQLVYLHFYRNEIVLADTNLNLIYRGHTIDTFRRARIKVAEVNKDQNQSMLSSPPMLINGKSCVSGKYLFVQSNLLSINEEIEKFLGSSVIDVYDLAARKYLRSFYIDSYKSNKPTSFRVFGNQLAAIFDHYLVLYELSPELINQQNIENNL